MNSERRLLQILAEQVKQGRLELSVDSLHALFRTIYKRPSTRKDRIQVLEDQGFLIKTDQFRFRINVAKLREQGVLPEQQVTNDKERYLKDLGIPVIRKTDISTDIEISKNEGNISLQSETKNITQQSEISNVSPKSEISNSPENDISLKSENKEILHTEDNKHAKNTILLLHSEILYIFKDFFGSSFNVCKFFEYLLAEGNIKVLFFIKTKGDSYVYELHRFFGIHLSYVSRILSKFANLNILQPHETVIFGRKAILYKFNSKVPDFISQFIDWRAEEVLSPYEIEKIKNYQRKPYLPYDIEGELEKAQEVLTNALRRYGSWERVPRNILNFWCERTKLTEEKLKSEILKEVSQNENPSPC